MNRPVQIIAGVVAAAAATITFVWMPSLILAGLTFNGID
jgi:hypothetical protein